MVMEGGGEPDHKGTFTLLSILYVLGLSKNWKCRHVSFCNRTVFKTHTTLKKTKSKGVYALSLTKYV